jgi:hypothetical protein
LWDATIRDPDVLQSANFNRFAAISAPEYWSRFSEALMPFRASNLLVGGQPLQFATFFDAMLTDLQQMVEDLQAEARGLSVGEVERDVVVRMSPLRHAVIRIHPTNLGRAKPRPVHDYPGD